MTWKIVDQRIGVPAADSHDTTRSTAVALGEEVTIQHADLGGGKAVYLKGVASTVAGDVVTFNSFTGATTRAPATGGKGPVAVALAATVAGEYGFYQVAGATLVNVAGNVADGADVFMAATAQVDDAGVNGEQVLGAVFSSTQAPTVDSATQTGKAVVTLNRPFLQGQVT